MPLRTGAQIETTTEPEAVRPTGRSRGAAEWSRAAKERSSAMARTSQEDARPGKSFFSAGGGDD
ncbi:MAG TPA: hypothetical protein VM925_32885, partial [Labilithrix sp.]|nr:hypothetical protein [Labilithrix sp.]